MSNEIANRPPDKKRVSTVVRGYPHSIQRNLFLEFKMLSTPTISWFYRQDGSSLLFLRYDEKVLEEEQVSMVSQKRR